MLKVPKTPTIMVRVRARNDLLIIPLLIGGSEIAINW